MTLRSATASLILAMFLAACGGGDDGTGGSGGDENLGGSGGGGGNVVEAECGNNVVEGDEECDDGNLRDSDGCTSDCKLNVCGDGFLNDGVEECDDGNSSDFDGCTSKCKINVCGDNLINSPSEECDFIAEEGPGPFCTEDCKKPKCGDGILHDYEPFFEQCDDANNDPTDGCHECKINVCGDGFVMSNPPEGLEAEECDDKNDDDTDGCVACKLAQCGDGVVMTNPPPGMDAEECDDGNESDNDRCLNTCVFNTCGDGIHNPIDEECDDGDDDPTNECNACKLPVCGDGHVQPSNGEECDDGNQDDSDDCPLTCKPAVCGDGKLYEPKEGEGEPELCDDGNDSEWDECLNDCMTINECGDGKLWRGNEECDDGNDEDGDGCASDCTIDAREVPAPGETIVVAERIEVLDPIFQRPDTACQVNQLARYHYELYKFHNSGANTATLALELEMDGAGWVMVYNGDFSDGAPAAGCSPDQHESWLPFVTVSPGATISVVVTTREHAGAGTFGAFELRVSGVGTCGDGVIDVHEECDDNNFASGDGCNTDCRVEPNFTCAVEGADCTANECGDGKLGNGEVCDDGDATDAGGCNATCTAVMPGFVCDDGVDCRQIDCGDGFVDGSEQCDDGNDVDGDGCSSICELELTAEVEPNDGRDEGAEITVPVALSGSLIEHDTDWFEFDATILDLYSIRTHIGGVGSCNAGTGTNVIMVRLNELSSDGKINRITTVEGECPSFGFAVHKTGRYALEIFASDSSMEVDSYVLQVIKHD